jgi:4-amino-4-deoxy-L-arabinose transferase-like glycosyltransferase
VLERSEQKYAMSVYPNVGELFVSTKFNPSPGSGERTGLLYIWLVVGFLLLASCRIVATYGHLSHVYDEPYHALRGVQWLTGQVYRHTEHPPLGPAVCATVPVLLGVNIDSTGAKQPDGLRLLYGDCSGVACAQRLATFRVGNLLFLWLAGVGLYLWVARHAGAGTGVAAVGLWSHVPSVLAHSGVVSTDLSLTALLIWSVIAWEQAITSRHLDIWLLAGLVTGLALLTKYSALLFLPLCIGPVALYRLSREERPQLSRRRRLSYMACAALLAGFVIWLAFGFSVASLGSIRIDEYRFEGFPEVIRTWIVPAPEYVAGVIWTMQKLEAGHGSYLFSEIPPGGSPWFFPVALVVKTPLVIGLLFLWGAAAAVRDWWRRSGNTWPALPLVIAGGLMLAVIPSTINIGFRHLLPITLFVSTVAAVGLMRVLGHAENGRTETTHVENRPGGGLSGNIIRWLVWVGLAWTVIDSWRVHPHYLSYFSEPARMRSQPILIDSDLDWGQGLVELGRLSRRLGIERLQFEHSAPAELNRFDLPLYHRGDDPPDWLAISVSALYVRPYLSEYRDREADAVVRGGSIRLYRIQGNGSQH